MASSMSVIRTVRGLLALTRNICVTSSSLREKLLCSSNCWMISTRKIWRLCGHLTRRDVVLTNLHAWEARNPNWLWHVSVTLNVSEHNYKLFSTYIYRFFTKRQTSPFGCMNVICLYSNQPHVSATHVESWLVETNRWLLFNNITFRHPNSFVGLCKNSVRLISCREHGTYKTGFRLNFLFKRITLLKACMRIYLCLVY